MLGCFVCIPPAFLQWSRALNGPCQTLKPWSDDAKSKLQVNACMWKVARALLLLLLLHHHLKFSGKRWRGSEDTNQTQKWNPNVQTEQAGLLDSLNEEQKQQNHWTIDSSYLTPSQPQTSHVGKTQVYKSRVKVWFTFTPLDGWWEWGEMAMNELRWHKWDPWQMVVHVKL